MRVVGLYRIQEGMSKTWVLVFKNSLPHNIKVHTTLDLKGRKPKPGKSLEERGRKSPEGAPIKDNEIQRGLIFKNATDKDFYIGQVKKDTQFLSQHDLMDYSLLVGIYHLKKESRKRDKKEYSDSTSSTSEEDSEEASSTKKEKKRSKSSTSKDTSDEDSKSEKELKKSKKTKEEKDKKEKKVKRKKSKRNNKESEYSIEELLNANGILGENPLDGKSEVYFFGIIDCLTNYAFKKKLANMFKQVLWDGSTLSTVESSYYAFRFNKFMTKNLLTKDVTYDNIEVSDWEHDKKEDASSNDEVEVSKKYHTLSGPDGKARKGPKRRSVGKRSKEV